jgi:hypothetical protein
VYSRLRLEDYLAAAALFVVVVVALALLGRGGVSPRAAAMRCDPNPQLAVHYHAHLDLLYQGRPVTVPPQVGIIQGCRYWLHTYSADGVLHVEAPAAESKQQYTLGDFFWVWGQPLSRQQMATFNVGRGQQLQTWVNGRRFDGDPQGVVLHARDRVVLEVGPPFLPPPAFDWSSPDAVQEVARLG